MFHRVDIAAMACPVEDAHCLLISIEEKHRSGSKHEHETDFAHCVDPLLKRRIVGNETHCFGRGHIHRAFDACVDIAAMVCVQGSRKAD